eukprot:364865-Chlamydomonas_euryale.AAC.11
MTCAARRTQHVDGGPAAPPLSSAPCCLTLSNRYLIALSCCQLPAPLHNASPTKCFVPAAAKQARAPHLVHQLRSPAPLDKHPQQGACQQRRRGEPAACCMRLPLSAC